MKKLLFVFVLSLTLSGCNPYTKDEMTNIIQQKYPNAVSITVKEGGDGGSQYIWIAKDSNNTIWKITSNGYEKSKEFADHFNPVAVKIIE